jgi:hypothetical protein
MIHFLMLLACTTGALAAPTGQRMTNVQPELAGSFALTETLHTIRADTDTIQTRDSIANLQAGSFAVEEDTRVALRSGSVSNLNAGAFAVEEDSRV